MDVFVSKISQADHLKRIWTLCCQCAQSIYGTTPPTPAYALRTARLLFMTGAQESGFQWERQRAPRWDGDIGGFGKWQVEPGSITDSLRYLRARPDVLARATLWLFNDPHAPMDWIDKLPMPSLLWALRMDDNDKIGLLFCRLHYLRVKYPIPETEQDQAEYYKHHYNTIHGAATVAGTIANYRKYRAVLQAALNQQGA